jgi:hypothetical protein
VAALVLGACGGGGESTGTRIGKDVDVGVEITYTRSGGQGDPPQAESITIAADGTFEAVRAVGVAAAGRFAGSLDGGLAARVRDASAAVEGASAPDADLLPGAPRETISIGGAAPVDVSRASGQPWMDPRTVLMEALDAAVSSPADAVVLHVSADPPAARLEVVGDAALEGSSSVAGTAVLWSADWEEKGRAEVSLTPGGDVALPAELAPSPGDRLQVDVSLAFRTSPDRPVTRAQLSAAGTA